MKGGTPRATFLKPFSGLRYDAVLVRLLPRRFAPLKIAQWRQKKPINMIDETTLRKTSVEIKNNPDFDAFPKAAISSSGLGTTQRL